MTSRVTRLFLCLLLLLSGGIARGQIFLGNFSNASPLKIMPVGDSITDDCQMNGAWRAPLQPLLETNGFPFIFVGRQASAPGGAFTKVNHEGYCGAVVAYPGVFAAHQYSAINNYLQKIVPDALAVTNNTPDVMLILIGANDIGRGRDPYQVATNDVATLLSMIYLNAPNVYVGLAKITSLQNGNVSGLLYGNYATNVPIYNANLQNLVNQRRALGQKIFLADMYSAVDYNTMFNSDHVHPNSLGLQAIAKEWLARLQTITVQTNLVTTAFINGGATWKYNDSGQDLGTNWLQTGYDDSTWSNGVARLGYGDSVAATTVSFGPQSTNKYVTTYFRRSFVVPPNVITTNLNFRIAQSDGAVVYLNGQEIYRTNLPAVGSISYTNLALSTLTYFPRYIFNPVNVPLTLPTGTNWVEAEVHLGAVTNSAMGFDMELIGSGFPGQVFGTLQLSLPSAANENAGTLAGAGTLTVNVAPTNALIVTLRSSDTSAITVPASVVIPAGQTNVSFDITTVDDRTVDGDKVATIIASVSNYATGRASITVHNTDIPYLINLAIPATVTEGAGTLAGQGNLSVTPIPTNNLTINLTSSYTSDVIVPATAVISASQSNTVFNLNILDDGLLNGNQVVTITATAINYTNTQASMIVYETDTATLSVTLPASAVQSAGTLTNAGLASIATSVSTNYTVSLNSSDPSKLIVPATTILSNGQSSAMFNLTLVSNNIIEGPQIVTVTAHVTNWTDGSNSMTIVDDHPLPDHFAWSAIPSPQLIGEPIPVTITAQDAAGNTLDYRLPVALSALVPDSAMDTNTILNSPTPEASTPGIGSDETLGNSFTPNTNLVVSHVRSYFGDKVSIWRDSGSLLVSQSVVGAAGAWMDTPLPSPVLLLSGMSYRLAAHVTNTNIYWSWDLPVTFANGSIDASWFGSGDAFPNGADDTQWYFVDLRYATGVSPIPITPTQTANFVAGTWSGNITVLQAATNLMLEATAGPGSFGVSPAFNVLGTPKLAITTLSNSVVLSWPVAATGFNLEQSPTLSNWTANPVTPAVVGDRYNVTNAIGAMNVYYRLHKP